MFPHKVKIVRNYNSKDEKILKDVSAYIQPELSFFDDHVDIKKGDYVIVPELDEPLIVSRVEVRPRGRGVYIKEVKFISESEFLGKENKSGISVQEEFHGISRGIQLNNISATIYLQALENSIENSSDIPLKQKESLIKKVRELENDPYIESLITNLSLSEEKLKNFNLTISY
jgi:hypothetical protein